MLLVHIKIFTLILLSSISCSVLAYEYKISEQALQQRLSEKNWVYENALVSLHVQKAKIFLLEDNARIAMNAEIKASLLKQLDANGFVNVEGELVYVADQGAFYLANFKIKTLEIDNLDHQQQLLFQQGLEKALRKILSSTPIYRLDDSKLQEKLAKSRLISVNSQDKQLIFNFNLF